MIVVADASVLVAELLRRRGRELISHPALRVVVAQEQWEETGHELTRRLTAMLTQNRLTAEQASALRAAIDELGQGSGD